MTGFNVGDVVCLKSGGPSMTVVTSVVHDEPDYCYCVWFDVAHRAEPFGQEFKIETLVKVSV